MGSLIIRAGRYGEDTATLFQVPTDIEIGLLGRMIARTMNWDQVPGGRQIKYQIEAQHLGRMLNDGESISQAGILDNYLLVFHSNDQSYQAATSSRVADKTANNIDSSGSGQNDTAFISTDNISSIQVASKPDQSIDIVLSPTVDPGISADVNDLPICGWRALDIEVPDPASSDKGRDEEKDKDSGFIWRQLD